MKLRVILCCAALAATLSAVAQPAAPKNATTADCFTFSAATSISCDTELLPQAEYLAEYLGYPIYRRLTGAGAVVLTLNAPAEGDNPEAFSIGITPEAIVIESTSPAGSFNGIQALFRLLPPEIYTKQGIAEGTTLACRRWSDSPKFAYRGMMLDVTRTWMPKEAVMRYIDLLSYHNINKLHLTLSNDEGWRLEILSHPELAEVGGFRGGDSPIEPVYGKWLEKYGGYYTQDDMREMIAYAALRNIEIIPELNMPGHSRAIASVHPEIRCNFPADTISTIGYDYRSAWCVAREENYALIEDIIDEVCALFPSKVIHIGGDEVDMSQWQRCPDCRRLMQERGMTSAHSLEDLFLARVSAMLEKHGKTPGVWNEAAHTGDFTRESLIYGWADVKACRNATAKGYKTVVMPGQYFYFDMRQTPREDGHDWAAIFDASKVHSFDLQKQGFTAAQIDNVAGLEGTFFSEAYVSHSPEKPDYLDYMCFPRVCVLSRLAWSGNTESWDEYYDELCREHYPRMAAMGIRFRLFPPRVTYENGTLTVTADNDGSQILCIVDDGVPQPYTAPIVTSEPHRYRFYTSLQGARSPEAAHTSYYKTIRPALTVTTSMGESSGFPYTNASEYRGLARTRRACRVDDWVMFRFHAPVTCREMTLRTGNMQLPKTIITTGYAEVSYDGVTFEPLGDLFQGGITFTPERAVRAVRFVSTSDGNGTPWVSIQPPVVKPKL